MRNIYSLHANAGAAAHVYFASNNEKRAATTFVNDSRRERRTQHRRREELQRMRKPSENLTKNRGDDDDEEEEDGGIGLDEEKGNERQQQQQKQRQTKPLLRSSSPRHARHDGRQEQQPQQEQEQQQQQQRNACESELPPLPPSSHDFPPLHHDQTDPRKTATVDDDALPIMKSSRTIRVSYTPLTYLLQMTLIGLYLHTLSTRAGTSPDSFPTLFNVIHLLFHIVTLVAHSLQLTAVERFCIIYGTWVSWIGWVETIAVFAKAAGGATVAVAVAAAAGGFGRPVVLSRATTTVFWLLMMERRDAWGIVVWEHLTRLSSPYYSPRTSSSSLSSSSSEDTHRLLGMTPLAIYRLWTHLGVGSAWWLTYLAVAVSDGRSLFSVLTLAATLKVCGLNIMAGSFLTCWWSFWTFQYRGVVWRREMREGAIVWWSEGLWGGECV